MNFLPGTVVAALLIGCGAPSDDPIRQESEPQSLPTPATPLPVIDSGAPLLHPIDAANASFRSFRAAALQALAARDTAFLYGMLAPEIRNSFGGDDSIAGFRRIWRMEQPASPVWDALSRVLQLGGRHDHDSVFVAPYVYALWPDSIDAFEHVAVVTANARVHQQPADSAQVIGALSHSILRLEDWKALDESGVASDSTWARVTLPDGRSGWVRGVDVYSPVGWRAFFVHRAGRWVLQFFVAGD